MKKVSIVLLVLILLIVSFYCGIMASEEYIPLKEAVEKAVEQKETIIDTVIKEEESSDPINRVIDFDELKQINQDAVGWVYIPDTSVDYPILIGDSDDEYLKKDIEGDYSILGSIFTTADTSRNLSDARTVLYGHNMRDYQMFGELKRYLEKEFRNNHTSMYVYTENRAMELTIFSIFVCKETDSILSDETVLETVDYRELLENLSERNEYSDISIGDISNLDNRQCFSLVTCRGQQGTSSRLIISGIVMRQMDPV